MNAITENITIEQGADFDQLEFYLDDDGTLYDMSNHTARMHIRADAKSNQLLTELTTENGLLIVRFDNTLENGVGAWVVQLNVSAATSSAWTFDKGSYDLELVAPSGRVTRVAKGTVTIDREVTR